jgi:polyribonucleotide nucleotidyltransferase
MIIIVMMTDSRSPLPHVMHLFPDPKGWCDCLQEAPQAADKAAPAFHKYRAGNLVSGVVARVAQYGAFVDTEDGVTGLIHISQISHERLSGAGDVFQVR